MKKYTLELDEEQARAVKDACELTFRLMLGQVERLLEYPMKLPQNRPTGPRVDEGKVHEVVRRLSYELTGTEFQASWSIGNKEEVPETARLLFDVMQVIRSRLEADLRPNSSRSASPYAFADRPLPVIRLVPDPLPEGYDKILCLSTAHVEEDSRGKTAWGDTEPRKFHDGWVVLVSEYHDNIPSWLKPIHDEALGTAGAMYIWFDPDHAVLTRFPTYHER